MISTKPSLRRFSLLTKSALFLNTSLKSNDSRAEKACLVNQSGELLSAQGRALGEQKNFPASSAVVRFSKK